MNWFYTSLFMVATYTIGRMAGIMSETEKRYKLDREIDALRRDIRKLQNIDKFGYGGK